MLHNIYFLVKQCFYCALDKRTSKHKSVLTDTAAECKSIVTSVSPGSLTPCSKTQLDYWEGLAVNASQKRAGASRELWIPWTLEDRDQGINTGCVCNVHCSYWYVFLPIFIQEKLKLYTGMLCWKVENEAPLNFHLEFWSRCRRC